LAMFDYNKKSGFLQRFLQLGADVNINTNIINAES